MDELEKIAPELSKIKKENPFRVPDNYFDDFSVRLQKKLDAEKAGDIQNKNRIIQFLKPAIGLAAGFALIIMISYWPLKTTTTNQNASNTGSESDISEMLYANMVEGIDVNSFYALLNESNGKTQLNDDDLATFISSNTSEYDIYSETNN